MIVLIVGDPGKGKSLRLTYKLGQKMLNGFEDYIKLKRDLRKLKVGGGFSQLNLPEQKHLVYADFDLKINKRLRSYWIDGYQIAMPNDYFDTILIPFYSTIGLDEGERYFDSRNTKGLREEVYRFPQLHRHGDYDLFIVSHRVASIDVNIRSMVDKIEVMNGVEFKKDKYGFIKSATFKLMEFNSCNAAEKYQLESDNKDTHKGKHIIEKIDLPCWNWYNTKSFRPAFLKDRYNESYSYAFHSTFSNTLEGFIKFNNTHSYFAPTGYLKNEKYDEKIRKAKEQMKNGN